MCDKDKKDVVHGALAKLTQKDVLRAASYIKEGKVYSLAVETSAESHAMPGRFYQVLVDKIPMDGQTVYGENQLTGYDDFISLWCGVGTHMDGFGHVAVEGKHLGGLKSEDVIGPRGAIEFGMETVPPIVTRGVMLDIPALKGVDELEIGYEVTVQDIEDACSRQGMEIEAGDVVLIHTGLIKTTKNDRPYIAHGHQAENLDGEPGIGLDAAIYLAEEKGVVVVGSDNWAIEVLPSPQQGSFLPVHDYLLTKAGIHLVENVWTRTLSEQKIYTFALIIAPPRFAGAVQAPVNPLAII